jgi:hypothetical protein
VTNPTAPDDAPPLPEATTPLGAVQRAAVARALADPTAAPEYLAFVGAVETARAVADETPAESFPLPGLAVVTVIDRLRDADEPEPPPVPTGGATRRDLRVAGAVAAVRRLDLPVDRAAGLAAVPRAEVRTALDE